MSDFSAAVARLRAAMGGDDVWEMPEPPASSRPSADLRDRRRMGRAAYERAMVAHGISGRTARVWASASYLFDGLDE